MTDVPKSETISTKQQRIANLARRMPNRPLHSLSHHIDIHWMRRAYQLTRKDGAVGVDGQTAADFAENLEDNLQQLLSQAKSGLYRAPPVRRVDIPKGDGKSTRPIGITTFADKVLQRAVMMVLEPLYEQDFYPFSYGFRPGRSAHQALRDVQHQLWKMGGGVILEVDISSFFDTIDRGRLQHILRQRVSDGVIVRLIGKWLRAGVLTDGRLSHSPTGVPQGGVISPLLSNLYLHEVMDEWWAKVVLPRLKGEAYLFRYADDLLLLFSEEVDAHRVESVLSKRFTKYGLSLHPTKTRQVSFFRPRAKKNQRPRPGTFTFLGFTHYWARSRQGRWIPKQKTAASRFRRTLRRIKEWCRSHRHLPIPEQSRHLGRKLRGHYSYFGITGNSICLSRMFYRVKWLWHKWLNRRSQRARLSLARFTRLLENHPLPAPVAVHSALRHSAKP